mmetsp:Transcript_49979/g.73431  ORF Transcript_49979/g.73431 Transcript_49979/m.73431 type:complete len:81 (-) Transcript_49979:953-1195(-)
MAPKLSVDERQWGGERIRFEVGCFQIIVPSSDSPYTILFWDVVTSTPFTIHGEVAPCAPISEKEQWEFSEGLASSSSFLE